MTDASAEIDLLCVGHASYDLVFSVPHHPAEDEKIVADDFIGCGGGPAATAAVTAARLGCRAAFAGYLGEDLYGEKHWQELVERGVDTRLIARGASPTPLSTILVKPDGTRALVNYKGATQALSADAVDCSLIRPKVILFDGHEPHLSLPLVQHAREQGIPTVLDAGSLHQGTEVLMDHVDYLVCSEKFAGQFAGNEERALARLAERAPVVVITLGVRGLIWQRQRQRGTLSAFPVSAIDTTGAGDAFHGAFSAALASAMAWPDLLRYASAAGALCCTRQGARCGIPSQQEHSQFLKRHPIN